MLPFSAECLRISAPRQVALPTEAWWGAEICGHSVENGYVNLPGPLPVFQGFFAAAINSTNETNKAGSACH